MGVLPVLTIHFGPRTAAAIFSRARWPAGQCYDGPLLLLSGFARVSPRIRALSPSAVIEATTPAGGCSGRNQTLCEPPSIITERRLGGRERHVVGQYRLGEALEASEPSCSVATLAFSATLTR